LVTNITVMKKVLFIAASALAGKAEGRGQKAEGIYPFS
jgi:hypothetical protein